MVMSQSAVSSVILNRVIKGPGTSSLFHLSDHALLREISYDVVKTYQVALRRGLQGKVMKQPTPASKEPRIPIIGSEVKAAPPSPLRPLKDTVPVGTLTMASCETIGQNHPTKQTHRN